MTLAEFTELVETYGAVPGRWPDDRREAAQTFITSNPDLCEPILAEEAALEELLNNARLNPGTDMLKARIMSSIDAPSSNDQIREPERARLFRFGHKAMAALMLVSFSLGFAGASVLQLPSQNDDMVESVSDDWAELADDYGVDDIYDWLEAAPAP